MADQYQHEYTDVILAEFWANVFTRAEVEDLAKDSDLKMALSAQEVLDILEEEQH